MTGVGPPLALIVAACLALSIRNTRAQPLSGTGAHAQELFVCHLSGKPDRLVGIYRPAGAERCRVDYTRDGRTRSLWSSRHDYPFCVRKALDIIGLLESVHFECSPRATDAPRSGP